MSLDWVKTYIIEKSIETPTITKPQKKTKTITDENHKEK